MNPRKEKCYKFKMTADVAAYMKGKAIVGLKIPLVYPPETRLFIVEFNGGPTGRADLCTVIGTSGNLLILERRHCWGQGKLDDNLDELSLTLLPDPATMIDGSAIPQEETK
jgi:hypothetical protein